MIGAPAREALRALLGTALRENVSAQRLTSLRVGGAVDALATPQDRAQLAALLTLCARHKLPYRVLGRGFNTIVRDGGLAGVVIQLSNFRALSLCAGARDGEGANANMGESEGANENVDASAAGDAREADGALGSTCCLRVEAGVSHATLTQFCRRRGFSGLEFGAGIPGSVGGWLAMNAGIPGREIGDAVLELEVMAPAQDKTASRFVPRKNLDFRYRELRGLAPGAVLLAAKLEVTRSTPAEVAARIQRELDARAARQPLDQPSCGSVFRNPPQQHAGQLVDAAGLRGRRHGGARISKRHANFIVNEGKARAADVLALIALAREEVRRKSGVELETEVQIWGCETGNA